MVHNWVLITLNWLFKNLGRHNGTEALEEVLRLHAFLAVVFVSHTVDGTGDTLCLTLLTLLYSK